MNKYNLKQTELQLAFNEDCMFNDGSVSSGPALTYYRDMLSESVGISILTCGKLRIKKKVGSCSSPAYFSTWLHLGEQLHQVGGRGGLAKSDPPTSM